MSISKGCNLVRFSFVLAKTPPQEKTGLRLFGSISSQQILGEGSEPDAVVSASVAAAAAAYVVQVDSLLKRHVSGP